MFYDNIAKRSPLYHLLGGFSCISIWFHSFSAFVSVQPLCVYTYSFLGKLLLRYYNNNIEEDNCVLCDGERERLFCRNKRQRKRNERETFTNKNANIYKKKIGCMKFMKCCYSFRFDEFRRYFVKSIAVVWYSDGIVPGSICQWQQMKYLYCV